MSVRLADMPSWVKWGVLGIGVAFVVVMLIVMAERVREPTPTPPPIPPPSATASEPAWPTVEMRVADLSLVEEGSTVMGWDYYKVITCTTVSWEPHIAPTPELVLDVQLRQGDRVIAYQEIHPGLYSALEPGVGNFGTITWDWGEPFWIGPAEEHKRPRWIVPDT